jgi:Ca2+-binding EF-hand superfamily protein
MSISSVGLAQTQHKWRTFDSTDTNGDGALSLDEFSAIGQNVQGGSNGLGSDNIQSLFSAIDTDSDGKISKTEAKTAFDKLSTAMQSQLLQIQEQSGGGQSPKDVFASADTDGSGGLSLDEFKAAAAAHVPPGAQAPDDDTLTARFKAMDKDGDGTLSQDEMKAAHRHHHAHAVPPPDQTDGSSADSSGTASSSLDALFLQAVSAYSNTSQSAGSDTTQQLLDILNAA